MFEIQCSHFLFHLSRFLLKCDIIYFVSKWICLSGDRISLLVQSILELAVELGYPQTCKHYFGLPSAWIQVYATMPGSKKKIFNPII